MSVENMLQFKTLTVDDIKKFGVKPDEDDEDSMPNETFLCAQCTEWLNGFCYKHPVVFVKEKTPHERPYLSESTFPSFFYLDDSTIPHAGKGVFARIRIPAGVAFGPYSGCVSKSKKAETSGYSWTITQEDGTECWVDAKNPFYSNWMRYVNCPRCEEEQNMVALLYNRNIYYYTYKPVEINEELMVWYGGEYGEKLGIKNSLDKSGPFAPPLDYSEVYSKVTESVSHSNIEEMLKNQTPAETQSEDVSQL